MSKTVILQALQEEIEHLQKCEHYLNEIMAYLHPYDHEINGKESGNLIRAIHEFLYDFDDSA